jgi:peptidoglycan hydrolase-like protein with peptidoglycan-binding domain
MADKWHDINAPGVWQKPNQDTPQSGSTQPADAAEDAPPEPPRPLVKLSEGKFVPPDEGTEINKKCPVQVNVEYLDDSAKSMQKVTFSLYANYNDTVSNLSHYVDGYEKDGIAQAEMTMYPPPAYKEGDSVDYFFKAEHIRGEKIIDSEDLTLPMETKPIILQKGDYDENGAEAYNKEQSGENFKPNNVVKKLQQDLITICFLPKGSDDGFFGDQTDKVVKEFQDYAIKLIRMKRSAGKTENTDKGLDQESPDGIVGEKTRDELDKWLSNNWIKPIPTLRHGEYDDTGVDNGKGKRGTDEHHQGTPVVEAQQNLQKVGLYLDFKIDGWFHDNMLCGVKDFQSAAADATFVVNGKLTIFDQKLTGFRKEELCPNTQEYLKMVVDKRGVVSKNDSQIIFGKKVSKEFKNKVISICKNLGIDPDFLMASIAFESGESFSSSVENAAGSGAVGLIQFMPATAKGLGTTTEELKKMTAEKQLDYVEKFFSSSKGKIKNLDDVYMAILWPAAIGKPDNFVLFEKGTNAYTQNSGLDIDSDGKITKSEAAAMVRAKYNRGKQFLG